MKNYTVIPASEALDKFADRKITVQTARPTTVMKDGREVPAYNTRYEPLALQHILSAKRWDDGRLSITTIDGQRYEIGGRPRPRAQEDENDE